MKVKLLTKLVAGLLVAGTVGKGQAVMISPQGVVFNSMGSYRSYTTPEKMIDHSGLVTDFTSGSTELPDYLGNGNTGHRAETSSTFVSNNTSSGYVDFDLGGSYEVSTFLLWNDSDAQGINDFQLLIDDDPSFPNPKVLGTYSAAFGAGWTGIPMQQFKLNKERGRFVRLEVLDTHKAGGWNNLAQIAEIAFDASTPDLDGDGVQNDIDNCPNVFNPDQANFDDDSYGNACDPDDDNDEVLDSQDNCQYDFNPDQYDFDNDGVGDVCDTDVDGDGVVEAVDACLDTALGDVVNEEGCSIDQLCPADNEWMNHGAYVSCIALAAENFAKEGLLFEGEKDDFVADAAASNIGKPNKKKK